MLRNLRKTSLVAAAALAVGVAACRGHNATVPGTLPSLEQAPLPNAALPQVTPTPPVTAPVNIPYPYTNNWTTRTWTGPTAPPVTQKGSDSGVITVKFRIDKSTGVYDVLELIKSNSGSRELLNSAIGFEPYHGGIAQIILSDNFTFKAGALRETGLDTYPSGQNSFDFPLTKDRRWSAAARHTSSVNIRQFGSNAFAENTAYTEAAAGSYAGQTSFSSTKGSQNQDNYASTTRVKLDDASVYTLSERAAGYNKLTQLFELPHEGFIAVRSLGKEPLPFKRGTVKVPDWYPGDGPLPNALYADNFRVVGHASMPSSCGTRAGQSSTEVIEEFANLDPVQGFYDTYKSWYYLAQLAKGQYWFACIVEKYTNDTYANGWAMSAGNWGGLSSEQIGTEILIASGAKSAPMMPSAGAAGSPALRPPSMALSVR